MSRLVALTREVTPAIARCELTHLARVPIDFDKASLQHQAYEGVLAAAGCTVRRLRADPEMADAVFIEDVAVVLDELAIVMRPGALSRRDERPVVEKALAEYRPVTPIEAPGTIDGGDVLVIGRTIFIGISSRTNDDAVEQVRRQVAPFGYDVRAVAVRGCLHLKSAVTAVREDMVLINPSWAPPEVFRSYDQIPVDEGEPSAANLVAFGSRLVYPAAFPRTRDRLEARGFQVDCVDVSELAKAEGAVTCCSLIFAVP